VKRVTDFIVLTADLVEAEARAARDGLRAEGRALRKEAGRMAISSTFLVLAAPLAIAGCGFCAAALYVALRDQIGAAGALLAVGLILLALGGALVWMFRQRTQH
jgi:hypothetical protein